MKAQTHSRFGPFGHLGRAFWVRFLAACAVVLLLEAGFDRLVESEGTPGLSQSVFNFSGLYQRIVAAPRNPVPRYTAVVEIDPEADAGAIGLNDVCAQRAMLAKLLRRIAAASPSVIVVDKYFLPRDCGENNRLLWGAVRDTTRNIPVVIGRRVSTENIGPQGAEKHFLAPSLSFQVDKDAYLRESVVNIDPDTRKLPLKWNVYASKEDAEKGQSLEWYETLALTAARAFDSELLGHHPALNRFVTNAQHPYISFMKKEVFSRLQAGKILSGGDGPLEPGASPSGAKTLTPEQRKLRGKVVLIGEINPDVDEHPSVVGSMPGLYMQANYVEALLDDRYYRPLPVLDYILGLAFLIALELILIVYHGNWWKLVGLIVLLFFCMIGLLYLIIMHLGWYVNPALVGAVAVLIKILHTVFGPAELAAEEA